ncbi:MAG: hypothetical protein J5736_00175 [Bacilli bacterium]|nr:hypothetical protein [Bacilli bacterium]
MFSFTAEALCAGSCKLEAIIAAAAQAANSEKPRIFRLDDRLVFFFTILVFFPPKWILYWKRFPDSALNNILGATKKGNQVKTLTEE